MKTSRIPEFANKSSEGMTRWFSEMALRGLLFHPEDRPRDIITIDTGKRAFTRGECARLDSIITEMFDQFGSEVCAAAYPVFMNQMGLRAHA